MSRDIKSAPPAWCANAVPSDRGWRHPVTGELLVSVKGGCLPGTELLVEVPVEVEVLAEEVPIDVLQEEVPVDVIDEVPPTEEVIVEEAPVKKTTKKKKKAE